MRRHLLLTRQPRQFLLGPLLLKRQPLAKRIVRQQALLPNALGVHTQSERLPKADPQQFWQPRGTDSDATTWPLASAEAGELLIPVEAEENAASVTAQASDRLDVVTLPISEVVRLEPGNVRKQRDTELDAAPLVPLLATPEPSRVLPELPLSEEEMIVEDIQAENQVVQRLEQPEKRIRPEMRTARSRISEGQAKTEETIQPLPRVEKMNGHGERSRRNELAQEMGKKALPPMQPGPLENAHVKRPPQMEDVSVKQSELTMQGNMERRERDELFAPGAGDRSPRAWLARLQRQVSAERTGKNPAPAAADPPTQRARTFLKPLLGIDPAEVPIYRDTQTGQAASALNADAFSVGETVGIAPAYAEETPEGLGLLAHELTHVVRQQRPRFIPPVVRPAAVTSGPQSDQETSDEEEMAVHVEQRVRRLARAASTSDAPLEGVPREPEQATVSTLNEERAERGIWGNLPAPWEPLPAWLVQEQPPASSQPSISLEAARTSAGSPPGGFSSEPGATHTGGTEAPIMRAGRERSVSDEPEREASTEQGSQEAERQLEPEPDLDALAQQVYGLLKRRLGVEQRRGGLMS